MSEDGIEDEYQGISSNDEDDLAPSRGAKRSSRGREDSSIDQDFEDDHDGYDVRPGRFIGPDSTWRGYTRDERALAASFDQAEANDLSIHLYNAHAWKARLYATERSENWHDWDHKSSWIEREAEKLPFIPSVDWTAWPMRPVDVPRPREKWGAPPVDPKDDTRYCKHVPWRPSAELLGELEALILRKAKEQFLNRGWNLNPSDISDAQADVEDDREPSTNVEGLYSFTADDEIASDILRPTVRHLIDRLGDVMRGLHESRLKRHVQSRKEQRATRRLVAAERAERYGPRAASKRKRASSNVDNIDRNGEHATAETMSLPIITAERERLTPAKAACVGERNPVETRDWSEVLRIAALVGFDDRVVHRAAKRCSALFGEGINLRVMPLTKAALSNKEKFIQYAPNDVVTASPSIADSDETELDVDNAELEKSETGLLCPIKDCERHENAYPALWRLREHMKRKHGETLPFTERPALMMNTDLAQNTDEPDGFLELITVEIPKPKQPQRRKRSVKRELVEEQPVNDR